MVVHTAHVEGPNSHEPPSVKKDSRRPGGGRLAAEVLSAADGLQTGGWTGHRSADGVGEFADAAALAKWPMNQVSIVLSLHFCVVGRCRLKPIFKVLKREASQLLQFGRLIA